LCTYYVANGRDDGLVDERNDDVCDVDDTDDDNGRDDGLVDERNDDVCGDDDTDDDDACGDDDDDDDGHHLPHAYTLTHFIIIIIIPN